VLTLHGAGVAEGVDDIEADLCRAVRDVVSAPIPIVLTLDLHGNVTDALAEHVQVLLGDHEYPHVDMYDRGREAVQLLPALLSGGLRPVTHVERLPMLLPTTTTSRGPLMAVNELCHLHELRSGVVDVTFFHGFPYTDVPAVGSSVVVTTHDDRALARSIGQEVAAFVWRRRDELRTRSLEPAEAIRMALDVDGGPIVINETSDNPGGGAPGDGTHLLRAMLEARLENACFGYLVDPETVAIAQRAGVGGEVDVRLGGKTDTLHGQPIETRAYVKALTDGEFRLTAFAAGSRASMGPAARLRVGGVDVVVGSRRGQTFDAGPFLLHGIDVTRARVVALKSSHHFRAAFEPLARAIITADPPGLTTLRVESFERRRTRRPVWPLDPDAAYTVT